MEHSAYYYFKIFSSIGSVDSVLHSAVLSTEISRYISGSNPGSHSIKIRCYCSFLSNVANGEKTEQLSQPNNGEIHWYLDLLCFEHSFY